MECAWAASRTKNTYLGEKYRKLIRRLGKKKALVVIAHKMLVSIYYILQKKERYRDLGKDYFKKQVSIKKLKYYQKQIEDLGYTAVVMQN